MRITWALSNESMRNTNMYGNQWERKSMFDFHLTIENCVRPRRNENFSFAIYTICNYRCITFKVLEPWTLANFSKVSNTHSHTFSRNHKHRDQHEVCIQSTSRPIYYIGSNTQPTKTASRTEQKGWNEKQKKSIVIGWISFLSANALNIKNI